MSEDRDAFDRRLKAGDLLGYWMIPGRSDGYREPQPRYAPKLWGWQSLRGALDEAALHITKEEAHRRFIGLQHPDLEVGTTPNLMLGAQLIQAGETDRAAALRRVSLDQLADGGFGEYYEPFTGELLGSADQSWTAAVTLDWLAGK